jgi:hypothetical protein
MFLMPLHPLPVVFSAGMQTLSPAILFRNRKKSVANFRSRQCKMSRPDNLFALFDFYSV